MRVDEKYYKKLGGKLAKIREAKKLSQRKVAEHLGVTFQQYQKYETGVNRIPTKALVAFCDLTNSDIRDLAGVSKREYEDIYHKNVVNNYHSTTYIHNFNGLFSNLFNMDLRLMKNKIAVSAIIISIVVFFVFGLLKFFPIINAKYNGTLISLQLLVFSISFAVVMFIVFGYSWLTYIITFIAYAGLYATLYRFIFVTHANQTNRIVMYIVGIVLTIITFYILKKLKINIKEEDNKVLKNS